MKNKLLSIAEIVVLLFSFPVSAIANFWGTKASMPTARKLFAIGVVNNKIYAIGGDTNNVKISTNEEYDPATNTWTTKAPMPSPRRGLAIGVVYNKIYAIGGAYSGVVSTNECYDPATNTWTTKANMPTARWNPAIGVVNNKIYVIGGFDGYSYLSTNEEYDPATNAWTTKASMPTARTALAIGTVKGKIYTIGGGNSSGSLSTNEEYDPATNTWTTKASMPTARQVLAIGVLSDSLIYAIGGYNGSNLSTNECYDPATNTWATKASMPTARRSFAIGVVYNRIYAIGGTDSSYLSINEMYNIQGLILLSPNGSEAWAANSQHTIYWYPEDTVAIDHYKLLFSTDGGNSYPDTIADNITDTFYIWTTPSINSDICRIMVQAFNTSDSLLFEDASDNNFEIWEGYYLASSQYPMFRYNSAHTGRSPYNGCLSDSIKWYFTTGSPVIGSPIVGPDATIYFTSENDTLYAINSDGTKKWSNYIGNATKSTPAIAIDSTIYIGNSFILYAYKYNGKIKWEYDVSGAIVSSPVIGSDGTIYFGSTNNTLYGVNADGTLKWKFATGGSILSSPAISPDGIIYVGSNDNKLYAINSDDGTKIWSINTTGTFISSPALDTLTGKIYVGSCNGNLYVINSNGIIDNIFTAGDTITSSPAIGDSMIFIGSYDGKVYALDKNLNLKWSYQTGGKIESSPTIDADGYVYTGSDDGKFYCFRGSDSTLIWNAITGNAIKTSPAIGANSCIYIGSNDGRLYAFGSNQGIEKNYISPVKRFFLSQNSPNPFIRETHIKYTLPEGTNVNISVYNLLGRKVTTLIDERKNAGYYTITWNGRDNTGKKLPSGIYLIHLEAGKYTATRKISLIK